MERQMMSLRKQFGTLSHVFLCATLFGCLLLSSCTFFGAGSLSRQKPVSSSTQTPVYSTPVNHPVTTRGCGRRLLVAAGTSVDQTFLVNPAESLGYSTRSYRVHVPVGYQNTVPTPLVLYFHGFGGTATGADGDSGFSSLADQQHFIVAYGQGLPEGPGGAPFWASAGPIDYGIDDLHYVSLMLDDLQSKLCIDVRRIYETGFSNGGGMSGYLACDLAGRIAAFAPVSGNFYSFPGGCHPVRPVSILDIHGTADPILPYQGISATLNAAWPLPSIPQWLQDWATRDGCQQGPVVFLRTAQVQGEQWMNCQQGVQVVHYRIEGGGHSWPAMLGEKTSLEVMWNFFQAHPLPEQP